MAYIRCRTCGRYIYPQDAVRERYCSQECASEYAVCCNCGRYFRAGTGQGQNYCSRLCTVQYRIQPA